ncbi:hypothetical protein ACJ72_02172 [Emergomyces africanus]|uniref:Uncharacterized protein n=1 Tax=Emergomyces africanus TaxID=1955775 RepID=A0A1B7P370_9EURO|nr:hypothetical protein ACJ72_02172 [Emergomyces africanus]
MHHVKTASSRLIKSPLIARVPVLIRSNADEALPFTVGINGTEAYLRASLPDVPEDIIQKILDTYPISASGIANEFQRLFQINVSKGRQEAWANFAKHPSKGPGWENVPRLGVFGDCARLGAGEEGREVLATISAKSVDQKCTVWWELYDSAS